MYAFTYHRATGLRHAANMLEKLEEAARLEPASSEVPLERGRTYERQEQYGKALSEYQTSVRLNGSNPRARARLADLALRLRGGSGPGPARRGIDLGAGASG